jgi:branched-chain amino acid transport system substrate-binding protein
MTKIKGQRPDAIYFGGTTQSNAGQLLKDMKNAGLTVPLIGPDGTCENAIITAAGADTFVDVPFYATFPGLTTDELKRQGGRGQKFVEGYAAKYGGEPTEAYAVYGYEVGAVLLETFRKAGKKDREAIRKAAFDVAEFRGAVGPFRFDPNGDTTNQFMTVNRVLRGADGQSRFTLAARLELPPELQATPK